MRISVLAAIIVGFGLAQATTPSREALLKPFRGFEREEMKTIEMLFQSEAEGRLLWRKSWKKLKMRGGAELPAIFCFCSQSDLGNYPERRGLFTQETARFYRGKNETEWKEATTDGLKRLQDPKNFPIIDRKQTFSRNFEHLQVAFMPKICVREGLNVLQTYLVLFHELTHLQGLDPFYEPDLFTFSDEHKVRDYYFKELEKPGGEVDAFIAQLGAFRRLQETFDFPPQTTLEDFLTKKGRLLYRNKAAFLKHLLYDADYQSVLDHYLERQIVVQYNRAQSWWEFIDRYLEKLDDHLLQLQKQRELLDKAIGSLSQNAGSNALAKLRQQKKELQNAFLETNRTRRLFESEQKTHIDLMNRLDRRFPSD